MPQQSKRQRLIAFKLLLCSGIGPQQRSACWSSAFVSRNHAMHLSGETNRGDLDLWNLRYCCLHSGYRRMPPRVGVALCPSVPWGHHIVADFADAEGTPLCVQDDNLDRTRPQINAQQCHRSTSSGSRRCDLRSTQSGIDELAGVPGQVEAIRPGAAPDGEMYTHLHLRHASLSSEGHELRRMICKEV